MSISRHKFGTWLIKLGMQTAAASDVDASAAGQFKARGAAMGGGHYKYE